LQGTRRADEAGATGEKGAHAGGWASSIERVETFGDYLDDSKYRAREMRDDGGRNVRELTRNATSNSTSLSLFEVYDYN
jgi:hypothetical protein